MLPEFACSRRRCGEQRGVRTAALGPCWPGSLWVSDTLAQTHPWEPVRRGGSLVRQMPNQAAGGSSRPLPQADQERQAPIPEGPSGALSLFPYSSTGQITPWFRPLPPQIIHSHTSAARLPSISLGCGQPLSVSPSLGGAPGAWC